jgi:hypothetical protein
MDTDVLPSQSLEHLAGHIRTRQKSFLAALEHVGTYGKAAKLIGIEYHTVSRWIKKSSKFKQLAEDAKSHAQKTIILDSIEGNFYDRVMEGKTDGQSAIIGMFLAKRIDPAYRDNAIVNVQAHGPVAIQLNFGASPQLTKATEQAEE